MNTHAKVFFGLLLLGLVGIIGAKFALPVVQDMLQKRTSDAAATKGTLKVGVDNWIGYFPLCSPETARRMRHEGYVLSCEDDKADYESRMQRLAEGEIDLAVATIDAYLLNGAKKDFPGAIVAVIDESKGGDAIIARRAAVASLDALKRRGQVKVAFTPASPSEFLLKAIGTHFDVPLFLQRSGAWRLESEGSAAALKKLQGGEADIAVLWEPDVSKALRDPALVKLIGSESTQNLVVDVLLASRRLVEERPEAIATLLDQYFQALAHYRDDEAQLVSDVRQAASVDGEQAQAMLAGVAFASLNDNGAHWFGITPSGLPAQEALVDSIQSVLAVLTAAGDFSSNPLPGGDPYRITNRQFLAQLYLPQAQAATATTQGEDTFAPLDDAGWAKLREVGTLKVEPIGFQRGTQTLDEEGRATLDRMAERLRNYPRFRVLVKGHTGTGGDAQANLALSLSRAGAVADYLAQQHQLDPDRLRAVGYGGSQPLPRLPDESDRAHGYRLPRVEIALVAEGG